MQTLLRRIPGATDDATSGSYDTIPGSHQDAAQATDSHDDATSGSHGAPDADDDTTAESHDPIRGSHDTTAESHDPIRGSYEATPESHRRVITTTRSCRRSSPATAHPTAWIPGYSHACTSWRSAGRSCGSPPRITGSDRRGLAYNDLALRHRVPQGRCQRYRS